MKSGSLRHKYAVLMERAAPKDQDLKLDLFFVTIRYLGDDLTIQLGV